MEQEGDLSGIWAEVEGLIGDGDFEGAQEAIDEATEDGWVLTDLQKYLDTERQKHD